MFHQFQIKLKIILKRKLDKKVINLLILNKLNMNTNYL